MNSLAGAQTRDVMSKTLTRSVMVLGALLAVLFLAGCSQLGVGFTKIGDLLANPQKYSGQEVRVRGRVTNVIKLPFVATKIYSIRDDSGEINVRTDHDAPMVGPTEVHVKGVLDVVATIGQQNVGLHLREVERW
jgi:hypothetical protein